MLVIDLLDKGDRIYAGMSQLEVLAMIPARGSQFASGKGEGHFYYAQVVSDSPRRWTTLAEKVFNAGLR